MTGGIPTKPGISIASDISGYYSTNINIARTPFDMAVGCNISNIEIRFHILKLVYEILYQLYLE